MKTAIQEAISQLKEIRDEEMAAGWEGEAYAYDTAISILKDLLEKEKEVMCDFAFTARLDDYLTPDELFDKTFNTTE